MLVSACMAFHNLDLVWVTALTARAGASRIETLGSCYSNQLQFYEAGL
jgi:hypothetical protein